MESESNKRPVKLISPAGLKEKGVTFTNVHLARLEKVGKFPRRVRLGHASIAWVEDEVDAWIAEKVRQRGNVNSDSATVSAEA